MSGRPPLADVLAAVERRYGGRGPTYTREEQLSIHHGAVPEWLHRIARFHPRDEIRRHAQHLTGQLMTMRREFYAVSMQGELDEHDERAMQGRNRIGARRTG